MSAGHDGLRIAIRDLTRTECLSTVIGTTGPLDEHPTCPRKRKIMSFVDVAFNPLGAVGTTTPQSVLGATKHTLMAIVTGAPATCTINLDGSLDGVHWFDLSGPQNCAASAMFHVVDKPVLYVRGNLSALAGGTSPTVTIAYVGVNG